VVLLELYRRGEGSVELCRVTGLTSMNGLLGLAAELAAACRMAGTLEC
jgi:hypothetical protein